MKILLYNNCSFIHRDTPSHLTVLFSQRIFVMWSANDIYCYLLCTDCRLKSRILAELNQIVSIPVFLRVMSEEALEF